MISRFLHLATNPLSRKSVQSSFLTDLELWPVRGESKANTGKNILVRSLTGVGEIAATLVGRAAVSNCLYVKQISTLGTLFSSRGLLPIFFICNSTIKTPCWRDLLQKAEAAADSGSDEFS